MQYASGHRVRPLCQAFCPRRGIHSGSACAFARTVLVFRCSHGMQARDPQAYGANRAYAIKLTARRALSCSPSVAWERVVRSACGLRVDAFHPPSRCPKSWYTGRKGPYSGQLPSLVCATVRPSALVVGCTWGPRRSTPRLKRWRSSPRGSVRPSAVLVLVCRFRACSADRLLVLSARSP